MYFKSDVCFDGDCQSNHAKTNILNGRSINLIRANGGLIAGDSKTYELWVTGAIITITDQKQVTAIDRAINDAKKYNAEVKNYLEYMIENEGLLS